LVALVLLIISIALFAGASQVGRGFYEVSGVITVVAFIALLAAGGFVTYIVIYFRAVLRIIDGIRKGFISNSFKSLPGINVFTMLTYIGVGFTVLGSLISVAFIGSVYGMIYEVIYFLPHDLRGIINPFIGSISSNAFSTFMTLVTSGGIVVCVVALNQFNATLRKKNYIR